MGHALTRTSPKGTAFVGRCVKCGREDLGMGAPFEDCPADGTVDETEVLLGMIDGKYETGANDATEDH